MIDGSSARYPEVTRKYAIYRSVAWEVPPKRAGYDISVQTSRQMFLVYVACPGMYHLPVEMLEPCHSAYEHLGCILSQLPEETLLKVIRDAMEKYRGKVQ